MRLRDKLVLMYAVPNYNSDNRGKKEKEMKLRMLKASNSQQRNIEKLKKVVTAWRVLQQTKMKSSEGDKDQDDINDINEEKESQTKMIKLMKRYQRMHV